MKANSGHDAATGHRQPTRRAHGLIDRVADFFSPTLTCTSCGATPKQRSCSTTGYTRPKLTDKEWSRYAAIEVEYLCPNCEESFWVLEMAPHYPLL